MWYAQPQWRQIVPPYWPLQVLHFTVAILTSARVLASRAPVGPSDESRSAMSEG
jgi:hypothetical protein